MRSSSAPGTSVNVHLGDSQQQWLVRTSGLNRVKTVGVVRTSMRCSPDMARPAQVNRNDMHIDEVESPVGMINDSGPSTTSEDMNEIAKLMNEFKLQVSSHI